MRIALTLLLVAAPAACNLPPLDKIHLGDCVDSCNVESKTCLKKGTKFECREADTCFDGMTLCFDDASKCADSCAGCKAAGTCADEAECQRPCIHQANDCTDVIHHCVDYLKTCIDAQVGAKEDCASTMVGCVAQCARDAEALLRGKR